MAIFEVVMRTVQALVVLFILARFSQAYDRYYVDPHGTFYSSHPMLENQWIRQVSDFQHGPERLKERPPHTQHIDWHAMYPNDVILSGPSDRKKSGFNA